MNRISSPLSSRWAIVLLAAAVLALAGCGRKGPLDLPPSASPEAVAAAQADHADHEPAASSAERCSIRSYGADAPPSRPLKAQATDSFSTRC